MNLTTYSVISALLIMVWHFMFNTNPKNFGTLQMIGVFLLGGVIGWFMQSIETAFMMSIILSLVFI